MTVPPERQCTLPDCEREAVDPLHPGTLCESHLKTVENHEPVTKSEESDDSEVPDSTLQKTNATCGESAEVVPAPIDELDEVFVPIPPREKGAHRPRTPENLFGPSDSVLEAYLDAGHNYGVTCQGDLAAVDADEPDRLRELLDALPATAWQVSGSRTSEHHFLQVPGLNEDLPLVDPETGDELGHIKAAEQSYVVAPGSTHPSGNQYGPLQGETIATVGENELRDLIEPFRPDEGNSSPHKDAARAASRSESSSADIGVHDVVSRASHPDGGRCEHPFHGSDTGANFMVDEGGETWRCWRHDCTGNGLHLVGIDEGIISCGEWKHGGLDTDTWREIFAAAREAGYDLPEYESESDDEEHVAALPNGLDLPDESRTWGLLQAENVDDPVQRARDRTTDAITTAIEGGDRALIEALPTLGKSYGAVKAAARTGEPVTVLTTRGNKEQYAQLREWCDGHELDHYTLPAFTRDCDSANGEHGTEWKATVRDWYNRGATPQAIHKHAEGELGGPLPCQEGEHECPYASKWDIDPSDYDVLIGHYAHAHKRKVTAGRTVIVDESPEGAYETRLDHGLQGAVTYFLKSHDVLPFDDYTDLIEGRHDEQRRADALAWFQERDLEADDRQVFGDEGGHAAAPLAAFTILAGAKTDLGNGWERAPFGDGERVGLFNREQGRAWLLCPPSLKAARGVLALDGTPTKELWELAIGECLRHTRVLGDEERRAYLSEGLNFQFVRTTDAIKPYNNPDHVAVDQDAALLEAIREEHGRRPALLSTSTALDEYDAAGVLDDVAETGYYGNILGSNEFVDTRLGVVIGSNHYGDDYVKKWAAYAGATAERSNEKGPGLSYGAFGDKVLTHMREHDTLQAALRFGRDGGGAVVYVHTDTLPDWVPIAAEGRVLRTWSDGMRQVVEVASDLDSWRTPEIAAHPDVDIGERQVFDHLETLAERGYVEREAEGRGYTWRDTGLHRVNEHGDVELEPVDIGSLDADEVAELARNSIYTWEFRNLGGDTSPSSSASVNTTSVGVDEAVVGGDPPLDETD